jgi:hypothetical protein
MLLSVFADNHMLLSVSDLKGEAGGPRNARGRRTGRAQPWHGTY